jgi:hypothetical protein
VGCVGTQAVETFVHYLHPFGPYKQCVAVAKRTGERCRRGASVDGVWFCEQHTP